MTIETSSNQFFRVRAAAGIEHAWIGIEVKRVKGAWIVKAKAREMLVRKAATRIVEGEHPAIKAARESGNPFGMYE